MKNNRVILTGTHGMVAKPIIKLLEEKGYECIRWNRDEVSPEDSNAIISFIKKVNPIIIIHLAYGPISWSTTMAKYSEKHKIKFAYISTVNVYGDAIGPYTVDTKPIPNDDYSRYKFESEEAIRGVTSNAYIIRIGWQIGPLEETHPNNMLQYLIRTQKEFGEVKANKNHYLSTSLVGDCAFAIVDIVLKHKPNLYLYNTNSDLSFFDVASGLVLQYPKLGIKIIRENGMQRNEIMV